MANKIYDCIVATSKYTDNSGNEKRHWENVGAVFQDKDSNGNSYSYIMLKRSFNPAGIDARENSDAIRITLSKPKAKQQQSQNSSYNPTTSNFFGNGDNSNNDVNFY